MGSAALVGRTAAVVLALWAVPSACTFKVNMPSVGDDAAEDVGTADIGRGDGSFDSGAVDGRGPDQGGTDAGTDAAVDVVEPECQTDEECKVKLAPVSQCMAVVCSKVTWTCQEAPLDGVPCNDGDACTTVDTCMDGLCAGGGAVACPGSLSPCSVTQCNPSTGGCDDVPVQGACEDGDACTVGDQCAGGECKSGSKLNCVDSDPCTDDGCDPATGCYHVPHVGEKLCNDNDPCTAPDTCLGGKCIGSPKCVDKKACTKDTCSGGTCSYKPIPGCVDCAASGGSCVSMVDGSVCPPGTAASAEACEEGQTCCMPQQQVCDSDAGCGPCETCVGGTCMVPEELCMDGKDNDCDGQVDEPDCVPGVVCPIPGGYEPVSIAVLVNPILNGAFDKKKVAVDGMTTINNVSCTTPPTCTPGTCCQTCTAAIAMEENGLMVALKPSLTKPNVGCKANECELETSCFPQPSAATVAWGLFSAKNTEGKPEPQIALHDFCQNGSVMPGGQQ